MNAQLRPALKLILIGVSLHVLSVFLLWVGLAIGQKEVMISWENLISMGLVAVGALLMSRAVAIIGRETHDVSGLARLVTWVLPLQSCALFCLSLLMKLGFITATHSMHIINVVTGGFTLLASLGLWQILSRLNHAKVSSVSSLGFPMIVVLSLFGMSPILIEVIVQFKLDYTLMPIYISVINLLYGLMIGLLVYPLLSQTQLEVQHQVESTQVQGVLERESEKLVHFNQWLTL